MAANKYRMRDMSGILHRNWTVCTVLEKRGWFGWRQLAERHNDCYHSGRETVQARHIQELTAVMEADAKNRVIATFG